ncbi:MAG TPA: [NiFe]-hydrogenase assembly chaperone HybE [Anaeromyxobacteraceae bacterium]|nr:[NiFe]-hydrogenase assembly chaperone HybE [Anaeromyxobacteraceae bacterium]
MGGDVAVRRAAEVEGAFASAAKRLADLPICNPALRVEAVGFREWGEDVVGVLVSPWTVSLLVLGGRGGPLAPMAPGTLERRSFPSGEYAFVPGELPGLGAYRSCSLLSPPEGIASQDDARAAAQAVMEALLAEPAPESKGRRAFLTGAFVRRRGEG